MKRSSLFGLGMLGMLATAGTGFAEKSQKAAMLENGPTFTISGTVEEARSGSLTVQRNALPPAKLDVQPFTTITMDGKPVEAKYLQPGSQVQARFQLEGGKPIALSINAGSSSATGGSGAKKEEGVKHERGETRSHESYEHMKK